MTDRDEEISTALPKDLDGLPRRGGFRLRGLEMTRLESFVDAAFAFAVSMLVIAGQQVPDDIDTLLRAFHNVPAFAASIAVLAIFWRGHWLWSRRFGLEDGVSIFISWTMIFTMLIYVYPLKIIFGGMFYGLSDGRLGQAISLHSYENGRMLFALYGLGFAATAFEIVFLYLRAWQLRVPLQLNEAEKFMTRGAIGGWCIPAGVGLLSVVFALTLPDNQIAWSGWLYFSMFLLLPAYRRLRPRKFARLEVSRRTK
ncbi:MAG: TMEM175 family protein [Chthoniobacterales bacterium]